MPTSTPPAPDGTSIAWSRSGSGEPVVLVHGITESAASFDPITGAATRQVITLDLRGHGESARRGLRPGRNGPTSATLIAAPASNARTSSVTRSAAPWSPLPARCSSRQRGRHRPVAPARCIQGALDASRGDAARPRPVSTRGRAMFEMMMGDLLSAEELARTTVAAAEQRCVPSVVGTWYERERDRRRRALSRNGA